jgi:ABC-type uncharacterized transport system substrate-binding protein
LQLPHLPGRTQLKAIGKSLNHYSCVLCVASLYPAAPYGFFRWLDETLADAAKASLGRFCRERVRDFRWAALALLASALLAGGRPAEAHPHVWVTATSELVYAADGSLTGVRHAWTFDDMFSSHELQGIETKTKGVYTHEELQPLAQTRVEALKEYAYFTFLKANGKHTFGAPVDYVIDYKDDHLTLHFTLPLMTPVKSKTLFLEIVDRSYFIDFKMAEKDPVKLVDAPAGCQASVLRPMGDRKMAQGMSEDSFKEGGANVALGLLFDNKIVVDCP